MNNIQETQKCNKNNNYVMWQNKAPKPVTQFLASIHIACGCCKNAILKNGGTENNSKSPKSGAENNSPAYMCVYIYIYLCFLFIYFSAMTQSDNDKP